MHETAYDKRIFTPGLLFRDLGFLLSKVPALRRAMKNPEIGRAMTGKIMMVVTAVNGCTYCTWFHASEAATSGMSAAEIRDMFDLQFEARATAHELPALLYAQHFAETNRTPEADMTERLFAFYGEETATDVLLLIRVIFFGNLLGNTFDAFPSRLAGRPAPDGSAVFEALFYLATFWFMLPAKWLLKRRGATDMTNDKTNTRTGDTP